MHVLKSAQVILGTYIQVINILIYKLVKQFLFYRENILGWKPIAKFWGIFPQVQNNILIVFIKYGPYFQELKINLIFIGCDIYFCNVANETLSVDEISKSLSNFV